MTSFPYELDTFLNGQTWNSASLLDQAWPHEYLSRDHVDELLFDRLVHHIQIHGYPGMLGQRQVTYFTDGGMIYWTSPEDLHGFRLVNRCSREQLWEYRLEYGTLPEPGWSAGRSAAPDEAETTPS